MFDIYSYELKKEILSDSDLKENYFQAVSNSSWANYGYLVATEINGDLLDELKRLNQSFGIGFIELSVKHPFESKVICQARYKDLDFNTINKLCKQSSEFTEFVNTVRAIIRAEDDRHYISTFNDFETKVCDEYFGENEDDEIEKYCKKNKLHWGEEESM